jgi:hypothetical protein
MYKVSRELIVTPIIIWWLQNRERPAVRKPAQKFDGERFNLRRLNDLEVRKQYQIENTNRFAALENLNDDKDINWA